MFYIFLFTVRKENEALMNSLSRVIEEDPTSSVLANLTSATAAVDSGGGGDNSLESEPLMANLSLTSVPP
jgi:hypothetical protein